METIAVYWEARVKVYGITVQPGLALGVLCVSVDRLDYWSERIIELDSLKRFELVTGLGGDGRSLALYLIIEDAQREALQSRMEGWLALERSAQFRMEERVDMVFLHGPHFQDRFGIAEIAFSALAKNKLRIVLSGCAGTSMYLVFAEGEGAAANKILTDTFLIPTIA